MILSEAINFLEKNQPLPDDAELKANPEILQIYNEVRKYFLEHPNPRCIPLFLNSFGNGSGYGIYQLVEDVVLKYDPEQVVPYLIQALGDERYSIKYWNTHISSLFPDKRLVDPLIKVLESGDADIRFAAITSLTGINDERITIALKNIQVSEKDPHIIELIKDVIGNMET